MGCTELARRGDIFEGGGTDTGGGLTSLPIPLTQVIGRERDLTEMVEMLQWPEGRRCTITGPGGGGKTRLAPEVVPRLQATLDRVSNEGGSWIARALTLADELGRQENSASRAPALTGAAALAETAGDDAAAERHYAEAVSIWQESGDFQGQATALLFRWLIALGEDAFRQSWEAGQRLAAADAALPAIANDVKEAQTRGKSLLSARELDVLRLVAAFRSDIEIADTLFISYRTVTTHISHILTKLDVDSRHEAVSAARRLGLV